jgi:Gpi18-like mannosyltransferase
MRLPTLDRTDARLLGWTLLAKVAVLAIGILGMLAATGSFGDLLAPWHRWDAPHYTDVAVWGYVANDPGTLTYPGYSQVYPGDLDLYIVFFPLYPWLVGAVTAVLGQPILAAFIVTTAASLVVAPVTYRLIAADLGHRVGLWGAGFLLVFPTAYFLHIGYTEALFLALSFGALWLARTERWWAAATLGALAGMARVNGLVLIPTLAIEAWLQWRKTRRVGPAQVVAIGAAGVGFLVYLGVNVAVYGDPFAFREIQHDHWYKELDWPWVGIAGMVESIGRRDPDDAFMLGWMELAFTALGLVATVAGAFRFRPTWTAWMAGNWLLIVGTGFVMSVPRYSLVLFGIMAWAALAADRWRAVGGLLAAASLTAMAYFAWRFATGLWAF